MTFETNGRSFGIDVSAVREIRGWQQTTPLPNSSDHILGVINLRGVIVPVIDLRQRLGLGPSTISRSSVVIVVANGDRLEGVLADAVSDIVDVSPSELQTAPAIDGDHDDLVRTLAVKGGTIVALLELASIAKGNGDERSNG